jgi:hypothetical protein
MSLPPARYFLAMMAVLITLLSSCNEAPPLASAPVSVANTPLARNTPTAFSSPLTERRHTTADPIVPEGWLPYDATYYSFFYPPGHGIEVGFDGQYVVLYPTAESSTDEKIELAYLGYEVALEDDLVEWFNLYTQLGGIEPPDRQILEDRSEVQVDGTVTRRLHLLNTRVQSLTQMILLTHGRLVLSVNGRTHEASMTELLRTLADSIVFHADAPTTKAELYPNEEHLVTTLDEVIAIGQAPPPGPTAPDPLTSGQEFATRTVSSTISAPPTLSATFLTEEAVYKE